MKKFWEYSSRNRKFHDWHPRTSVLREAIILHWEKGWTQDAIAFRFDIHIDTVNGHLRRARRNGDARAAVRHAATRKAMELVIEGANQQTQRMTNVVEVDFPAPTALQLRRARE